MLKGIYLGACRAYHPSYNLDYNDIIPGYHNNIICDMLEVELTNYDYIIATPPCNWWTRANWRRNQSEYSLKTKHLLPDILEKCGKLNRPFIIENVRNYKRFKENGIIKICEEYGIYIYEYGRHTYFTNIMFNPNNIEQIPDHIQNTCNGTTKYRQGGTNVHNVIEYWLKIINNK